MEQCAVNNGIRIHPSGHRFERLGIGPIALDERDVIPVPERSIEAPD